MDEGAEREDEAVGETPPEDWWPLGGHLDVLRAYDAVEIVGINRMGAGLAFVGADQNIQEIVRILAALPMDWPRLSTERQQETTRHVQKVTEIIESMLKMDSSHINVTDEGPESPPDQVRALRDQLAEQLAAECSWFYEYVRPVCVMEPVRELVEAMIRRDSIPQSEEEVARLRDTYANLERTAKELQDLAPTVEAQRELLGASATTKLSEVFDSAAKSHGKWWRWWLAGLATAVAGVAVGGAFFIDQTRPAANATNAQTLSHLFLDLLVVGLLIYVIRVISLQFRAHRHMEVLAQNKANVLKTFNRLIVNQEPDVKAIIASAMAQAVFKVDEEIFAGDSASEQVTILERALTPGLSRLSS